MTYKITFTGGAEGIFGNIEKIELMPDDTRLERYESALHELSRLGNEPLPGNSIGNVIAQDALKGPPLSVRDTQGKVAAEPQSSLDVCGGESCKATTEKLEHP